MFRPRTALVVLAALPLVACGGGSARPKADLAASKITTIGVNSYLWRATLDTLSFMPLLQTDSNGGVIVTDWYVNPQTPAERMKVTVSILDQDLRADAVRVAALREINRNGQWVVQEEPRAFPLAERPFRDRPQHPGSTVRPRRDGRPHRLRESGLVRDVQPNRIYLVPVG